MIRIALRTLPVVALLLATACAGTSKLAAGEVQECRKLEITGSKIAKQDCRTVTEWAAHDELEAKRNHEMLIMNQRGASPATMQ